jgi:putative colanic acid biosynthesis glycosyltransferase
VPELSIIVVTFNAADTLPRTLASVACQLDVSPRSAEVLVIDGASTDTTVEIARSFDCVTSIISEPDSGIYDAMNKGARLASGRWVQFLNAGDTFTDSGSLSKIVVGLHEARAEGAVWAVGGARNLQALKGAPIRIPSIPHQWWRHTIGLQPHCHQASWFDRALFNALGGHSLEYGLVGDFDLILRFGVLRKPFEMPEIVIDYLGGGISELNPHVPRLLNAVRVDRLGISPGASMAIGGIVGAINRLRHDVGTARRYAKGVLTSAASGAR